MSVTLGFACSRFLRFIGIDKYIRVADTCLIHEAAMATVLVGVSKNIMKIILHMKMNVCIIINMNTEDSAIKSVMLSSINCQPLMFVNSPIHI